MMGKILKSNEEYYLIRKEILKLLRHVYSIDFGVESKVLRVLESEDC